MSNTNEHHQQPASSPAIEDERHTKKNVLSVAYIHTHTQQNYGRGNFIKTGIRIRFNLVVKLGF